jgi:hypothetical protein
MSGYGVRWKCGHASRTGPIYRLEGTLARFSGARWMAIDS